MQIKFKKAVIIFFLGLSILGCKNTQEKTEEETQKGTDRIEKPEYEIRDGKYYLGVGAYGREIFKDEEHVYFKKFNNSCYSIEDKFDAKSFEMLSENYYRDINGIYKPTSDEHLQEFVKDDNFDPKSFEVLGGYYVKDKDHIYGYSGENVINDADVDSFQALSDYYGKDKDNIYFKNKVLYDLREIKEFEPLGSGYHLKDGQIYWKDNKEAIYPTNQDFKVFEKYLIGENSLYKRGEKLNLEVDFESFQILNHAIGKDNNYIYDLYGKRKVTSVDVNSFELVGGLYAKDKDQVYDLLCEKHEKDDFCVLNEMDPQTFEEVFIHQEAFYYKDKNKVFVNDKEIKGADPQTFEVLNWNISKDKNNLYLLGIYKIIKVDNLDLNSLDLCNLTEDQKEILDQKFREADTK
jgi:hypothetical protein